MTKTGLAPLENASIAQVNIFGELPGYVVSGGRGILISIAVRHRNRHAWPGSSTTQTGGSDCLFVLHNRHIA